MPLKCFLSESGPIRFFRFCFHNVFSRLCIPMFHMEDHDDACVVFDVLFSVQFSVEMQSFIAVFIRFGCLRVYVVLFPFASSPLLSFCLLPSLFLSLSPARLCSCLARFVPPASIPVLGDSSVRMERRQRRMRPALASFALFLPYFIRPNRICCLVLCLFCFAVVFRTEQVLSMCARDLSPFANHLHHIWPA